MVTVFMNKSLPVFLLSLACTVNADAVSDMFFKNCNQIIEKTPVYKSCYNYNLKGSTAVAYSVDGNKLANAEVHIKKRPNFYPDFSIPVKYRSLPDDYTRSGYDRGHMANHADFDYSANLVYLTYSMSNIVPQNPELNRGSWAKLEKFERRVARVYGSINVVNLITYSNNPQRIGRSKVAVPDGFYKMIYNNNNLLKCFYYKNEEPNLNDNFNNHEVSCSTIFTKAKS